MLYNHRDFTGATNHIEQILTGNKKDYFVSLAKKLISEKIDVTAFMVWFVENYPESARILRENPDYQLRFK